MAKTRWIHIYLCSTFMTFFGSRFLFYLFLGNDNLKFVPLFLFFILSKSTSESIFSHSYTPSITHFDYSWHRRKKSIDIQKDLNFNSTSNQHDRYKSSNETSSAKGWNKRKGTKVYRQKNKSNNTHLIPIYFINLPTLQPNKNWIFHPLRAAALKNDSIQPIKKSVKCKWI